MHKLQSYERLRTNSSPTPMLENVLHDKWVYGEKGLDDMCMLIDLNQETLLENVKRRFEQDIIYTYTGSILVSLNPYQHFPIYGNDYVKKYRSKALDSMPPHIFAIADSSYRSMQENKKDQSILISGESGSGKTEATKLIMQYLAAMTKGSILETDGSTEQMILESSPILEAFGNAKTVRNNNSSRFGKFIEVWFDSRGQIAGARIVQYLLEKSRLVNQASDERNYHIFYHLIFGASQEEKESLHLGPAENFSYLNQSGCTTIDGMDEVEEWTRVKRALGLLMGSELQVTIFRLLAGILHLGNVTFGSGGHGDSSHVQNLEVLQIVSSLLQFDSQQLESALVHRQNIIKGESFLVPLNPEQAAENRDALAKSLYGKLFTWLVDTINNRIQVNTNGKSLHDAGYNCIGILDIFGFENFRVNSFEQFCINFANEKLQQHFNHHIFTLEQQEYNREGIGWDTIEFRDNQDTLDLIEKRPLGIFSLIDEECKFPQSTDQTMLQKLHSNHEKHPLYIKPRMTNSGGGGQFGVCHYSGTVLYDVVGFMDKNRDTLQNLLLKLCTSSKNALIQKFFAEEETPNVNNTNLSLSSSQNSSTANKMTVGGQFKDQLTTLMKNLSLTMPHYIRCIKPNTLKAPSHFDRELVLCQLRYAGMLETIRIRKLGYPVRYLFNDFVFRFRCTLTNNLTIPEKKSKQLNGHGKNTQESEDGGENNGSSDPLKHHLMRTISGSRVRGGSSSENLIANLVGRDLLKTPMTSEIDENDLDNSNNELKDLCYKILTNPANVFKPDQWKMGHMKVFLRDELYSKIESVRNVAVARLMLVIQKTWRMYKCRIKYVQIRAASLRLQTISRAYKARNSYNRVKKSTLHIQTLLRKKVEKSNYLTLKRASLVLQSWILRKKLVERLQKLKIASVYVQTFLRKHIAYKVFLRILYPSPPTPEPESESEDEDSDASDYDSDSPVPKNHISITKPNTKLDLSPLKKKIVVPPKIIAPLDLKVLSLPLGNFGEFSPTVTPRGISIGSSTAKWIASPRTTISPPSSPNTPRSMSKSASGSGSMSPRVLLTPRAQLPPVFSPSTSEKHPVYKKRKLDVTPEEAANYPFSKYSSAYFQLSSSSPQKSPLKMLSSLSPKKPDPSSPKKSADSPKKSGDSSKKYGDAISKKDSETLFFSPKPLTRPLHANLSVANIKQAIFISSLILQFINDCLISALQHICKIGIEEESLRDEIFSQIIKQLTPQTQITSAHLPIFLRGWELLSLCLGCFPPSPTLTPYLASFLYSNSKSEKKFGNLVQFCVKRLKKVLYYGPRKSPPSEVEMSSAKNVKNVPLEVRVPDGRDLKIWVESSTTTGMFLKKIKKRLGLKSEYYAFYECYKGMERSLENHEFVLDILHKWETYSLVHIAPSAPRSTASSLPSSLKFKFQQRIFPVQTNLGRKDETFLYHQAVNGVMTGQFPCNELQAVTLGTLAALHDSIKMKSEDPFLGNSIAKYYIPPTTSISRKPSEWGQIVATQKGKISPLPKTVSKVEKMYLKEVQSLPFYGSTIFVVQLINPIDLLPKSTDRSLHIAINMKGVHLLTPTKTLQHTTFANTTSYSHAHRTHIVKITSSEKKWTEIEVICLNGEELITLIKEYSRIEEEKSSEKSEDDTEENETETESEEEEEQEESESDSDEG